MSNQYYEFLALDRPLTPEETKALRAISSRAEISPSRFLNIYQDAVHYLQDLTERYRLIGKAEEFQRRFQALMAPYHNRRALWQRLKEAGLA